MELAERGVHLVLAAAALKPTFTRIGAEFEAASPGAAVRFDFASSPELATQLLNGAAADVFASADTTQMDKVDRAGLLTGRPVSFAANSLVIVTAKGNPKHIASFADLAGTGVSVVISPPPMPCGVATERVERSTGVHLNPVSADPDVEDGLNKVVNGEADAVTVCPIAVLAAAAETGPATRFVEFVTSGRGRAILDQAGFDAP